MLALALGLALNAGLAGAARQTEPLQVEAEPLDLGDLRGIRLSPDGTALAAVAQTRDDPALCVVEVPEGSERVCAELEPAIAYSFLDLESIVWSPHGSALAFSGLAALHLRDSDVWVMDATTGEMTNLTDDGYDGRIFPGYDAEEAEGNRPVAADTLPAWSPDGESLAFVRTAVGADSLGGTSLMRVDLTDDLSAEDEPTEIAEIDPELPFAAYYRLIWSPEGDHLYYTFANPDPDDERNGVWAASVDDGSTEQITEPAPRDEQVILSQVSPDGTRSLVLPLALVYGGFPIEATTHLLDLESGDLTPLVAGDHDEPSANRVTLAGFSPDGDHVIQGSISFGEWSPVTLLDIASGDVTPLAIDGVSDRVFGMTQYGGIEWAESGLVYLPVESNSGLIFTLDSSG